MWQFFGMATLVLGASSYFLYQQNEELKTELIVQKVAVAEQKAAFETLEKETQKQSKALIDMQQQNQAIQGEMSRYLDIFSRHNLTKLAAAKPGLIEKRANNATKQVFDTIESDSRDVDSADNGLQLAAEATSRSGDSNEASKGKDTSTSSSEGN